MAFPVFILVYVGTGKGLNTRFSSKAMSKGKIFLSFCLLCNSDADIIKHI